MSKIFTLLLCIACFVTKAKANYTTPGTGVSWTLNELVANSGGTIIVQDGVYIVAGNIIISANDAITINSNATLRFAAGNLWQVFGSFLVDPPTGVLFTAQDPVQGFAGIRLELGSTTQLNKLTLEYASSLRIVDCNPTINNCIFRYNTVTTSQGSAAIALFRASPTITNSQFIENRRAAITGGANIANAPQISGCLFQANNTTNANVPQINLGASGTDTVRILNSTFLGGNINAGAIGFFPTGTTNAIIHQNLIRGNRFGINLIGGSNINAVVSYNRIEFNNILNDPNTSGSGIAFTDAGGRTAQNTVVTGNVFEGNLWGITIFSQISGVPASGPRPNLGNLNNADTSDDGKNYFINNTNGNTPGVDFYNNSSDPIFAMGNYWNTNIESEVEGKIFHNPDNPLLGLVTYSSFIVPVKLTHFAAQPQGSMVALQWHTSSEVNSDHFVVETSTNGDQFVEAGRVSAAGYSSTLRKYNYNHQPINAGTAIYYRLKIVDKDGDFSYSPTIAVKLQQASGEPAVNVYPTVVSSGQTINIDATTSAAGEANLQLLSASGKLLMSRAVKLVSGKNKLLLRVPEGSTAGALIIRLIGNNWHKSISILQQ